MRQLSRIQRAKVVTALVEGNSIRATVRMTGIAKNTIVKLLIDLGDVCAKFQDETIRNVNSKRVQCDEIWSFIGSKEKNTTPEKKSSDCWNSPNEITGLDTGPEKGGNAHA